MPSQPSPPVFPSRTSVRTRAVFRREELGSTSRRQAARPPCAQCRPPSPVRRTVRSPTSPTAGSAGSRSECSGLEHHDRIARLVRDCYVAYGPGLATAFCRLGKAECKSIRIRPRSDVPLWWSSPGGCRRGMRLRAGIRQRTEPGHISGITYLMNPPEGGRRVQE